MSKDINMYILDKPIRSTKDWEEILGVQARRLRMRVELDQRELAQKANISVGALKNLENGHGCTLRTLIRVLRVLNKESWLETLSPQPSVEPIEVLRQMGRLRPRKRVYKPRKRGAPTFER